MVLWTRPQQILTVTEVLEAQIIERHNQQYDCRKNCLCDHSLSNNVSMKRAVDIIPAKTQTTEIVTP